MARPLALTLLTAVLAPSPAPAADDPIMVIVHFHPTPGREDELKARLVKLRDFVLLHETFPSQAVLDDQARTVFPAFQREHGPIPAGIVTRPVEPERFREVRE